MNKIFLMGRSEAGKTSLTQALKGEELHYVKASGLLFDDFRGGKIGRVTLEWAEQEKSE